MRSSRGTVPISLLVALLGLAGCTMAGYIVGNVIDESNAGWNEAPLALAVPELELGDSLVCALRGGEEVSGEFAGILAEDGRSVLRLFSDGSVRRVDSAEVDVVRFRLIPQKHRQLLTVVGIAADVAVLALLINSNKEDPPEPAPTPKVDPPPPPPPPPPGGGVWCPNGCPVVLGWTGNEWAMEAESFTGSVYRAAERSDVSRLERTLPSGDELRLRVANHLQEIDSLNRVLLLRVRHDPGVSVFPTEDGRLLAVDPVPPAEALSDRGRDVRDLVGVNDDEYWQALPAALPERRGERRWMECRFPLVESVDSVTLVMQVCNTRWGALLHTEFFTLFGSALQGYYDLWNGSAPARAFFHARMEQEAMLRVSVWDRQEWKQAGYIWEVGPFAPRQLALRVAVADGDAHELRVRFDAPGGLWQIGFAGMDARSPRTVDVTVLAPEVARHSDGSDAREALRTCDDSYLVLDTDQEVDLRFRVPPVLHSGEAVTWLLDVTGYYRMKLHSDDPPDTLLLGRLFGEPGFFARYADGRFWETVMALDNAGQR